MENLKVLRNLGLSLLTDNLILNHRRYDEHVRRREICENEDHR